MLQKLSLAACLGVLIACSDTSFQGLSSATPNDSSEGTNTDGDDGGDPDKDDRGGTPPDDEVIEKSDKEDAGGLAVAIFTGESEIPPDMADPLFTGEGEVPPDMADPLFTGEGEVPPDPTKCWFFVSGSYLGLSGKGNSYDSTFPLPNDGGPIGHGKKFDTVGGVWLVARDEPYVYREGGREIDRAVDYSFDSIGLAPGMHVEIRDASDNILFEGDGPQILLASDRNESLKHLGEKYQALADKMPPWMKAYFELHDWQLPRTRLHPARSVKVSKIKDVPCE